MLHFFHSHANGLHIFLLQVFSIYHCIKILYFCNWFSEEYEDENEGDEEENGTAIQEMEQMQEMPPSPARVAVHLQLVSSKLRRRLHRRARQDFQSAKKRTLESLCQLQQTLDIVSTNLDHSDYFEVCRMNIYLKST